MDEKTTEAIKELTLLEKQVDELKNGSRFDAAHTRWILNVRYALDQYFGEGNEISASFRALDWQIPSGTPIPGFPMSGARERVIQQVYLAQLETARGVLCAGMDSLRKSSVAEQRSASGLDIAKESKDIFISHGGQPEVLAKVERIVRVLGFNPVIVAREASGGKAVDDLVPEQMRKCICAIILATPDTQGANPKYPRPNVLHEIGLAQEILKDKVIYLKEESVDFPSNVTPKVWQTFTNDDPEPVWDKIIKELRGFDFLP